MRIKLLLINILFLCLSNHIFAQITNTNEPYSQPNTLPPAAFNKILKGFQWSGQAKMNEALGMNVRASGFDYKDLNIVSPPVPPATTTIPINGILQIPGKYGLNGVINKFRG